MRWRIPQFTKLAGYAGYNDLPNLREMHFFEIEFQRVYIRSKYIFEWRYWSEVAGWVTYFSLTAEQLERSSDMRPSGRHSFILMVNLEAARALAEMRFYKIERVDQESQRTTQARQNAREDSRTLVRGGPSSAS